MPRYQKTLCQDDGWTKGFWLLCPIDLRKKYYFCSHCGKDHKTREGVEKKDVRRPNKP